MKEKNYSFISLFNVYYDFNYFSYFILIKFLVNVLDIFEVMERVLIE